MLYIYNLVILKNKFFEYNYAELKSLRREWSQVRGDSLKIKY